MIVTTVSVQVKPEHVDAFIEATADNHRHSIKEPGNLRFDVLQQRDDPCRFTLYEAYETEEAVAAHKETAHYRRWRAAVEPWMAERRLGIAHRVLYPAEVARWKS
ncbi:MAG: antibiotic biosynthesis monooxygenase [Puniceicoccaceae bacterium]|nr:MAG: antibiotic biosynthesis monooxygenase [Puniceicoccaceae bacterium]